MVSSHNGRSFSNNSSEGIAVYVTRVHTRLVPMVTRYVHSQRAERSREERGGWWNESVAREKWCSIQWLWSSSFYRTCVVVKTELYFLRPFSCPPTCHWRVSLNEKEKTRYFCLPFILAEWSYQIHVIRLFWLVKKNIFEIKFKKSCIRIAPQN